MDGSALTFEQYDNEHYIVLDDESVGRIVELEGDNCWLLWGDEKIPFYGLEDAKQYAKKHYKEILPY